MNNQYWRAYFQFSQKEVKGIIALGVILFGSVLFSLLFPSTIKNQQQGQTINTKRFFIFDPNLIDSAKAIELGIPMKQVKSLLHYRQKGGYFKDPADFAKLYGLTPELFHALTPFIRMEKTALNNHTKSAYRFFSTANRIDVDNNDWKLDINNADESEWLLKTNLSKSTIHSIMAYKKYLGNYSNVRQVSKVYGLPDSLYQSLRKHLRVQLSQQLQLNATAMQFNDWKALGMFTDKQIWSILRLKKNNGGRLGLEAIVETCDLTQEEASMLKSKVRLSD